MSELSDSDRLLAAEYALGVLEGEAREAARLRVETDRAFAHAVEAAGLELAPLAETLPEHAPPAALKAKIEAAVFGDAATSDAAEPAGLWSSLAFWRAAAGVLAATTVIAAVLALASPRPAPDPALFAALQADPDAASVLIRFDPDTRTLSLSGPVERPEAGPVQPELWVIAPGRDPRSLGLIAGVDGAVTGPITVDRAEAEAIAEGATLAISLEPPGGSPTGAPTGAVIAAGQVRTL